MQNKAVEASTFFIPGWGISGCQCPNDHRVSWCNYKDPKTGVHPEKKPDGSPWPLRDTRR